MIRARNFVLWHGSGSRRGAAEEEKPRRFVDPIDEYAKGLEERRLALNLVNDHEAGQAGQSPLRRLPQPSPVHRAFEVRKRACGLGGGDLPASSSE